MPPSPARCPHPPPGRADPRRRAALRRTARRDSPAATGRTPRPPARNSARAPHVDPSRRSTLPMRAIRLRHRARSPIRYACPLPSGANPANSAIALNTCRRIRPAARRRPRTQSVAIRDDPENIGRITARAAQHAPRQWHADSDTTAICAGCSPVDWAIKSGAAGRTDRRDDIETCPNRHIDRCPGRVGCRFAHKELPMMTIRPRRVPRTGQQTPNDRQSSRFTHVSRLT